jgi:lipoprotein-anchoring transpeptidase ErfK/SrfK
MKMLSRRDFLKLSGAALSSLAFSPFLPQLGEFNDTPLVRVATTSVSVHSQPNDEYKITGQWFRDELVHVYEEVNSGTPDYNPIWYRVWGGYMHRAHLQKVKILYNDPQTDLKDNSRQLAEVTVPYTQALRPYIKDQWQMLYRLYYTTVHWVVGVDEGPDGNPWYRVLDELLDITYNVPAKHLRIIPPDEYTPISPEVPFEQKRIEVNLTTQTLTAYEYGKVVLQTRISSGLPNGNPGSNGIPTKTPSGKFNIQVKMPSKHMGNGNLAADIEAYELPGVPWTSFFTEKGHAFHGTYWHDNFGVPMSHGCVNMRTEEAKWLFRWCLPPAGAEDLNPLTLDKKGFGTSVEVIG